VAVEHRLMHAETLAYMLHQTTGGEKNSGCHHLRGKPPRREVSPGWRFRLAGRRLACNARMATSSAGDNEFETHEVRVADFAIDNYNVTQPGLYVVRRGRRIFGALAVGEGAWGLEEKKEGVQAPGFLAARRKSVVCSARCFGRSGYRWTGRCT